MLKLKRYKFVTDLHKRLATLSVNNHHSAKACSTTANFTSPKQLIPIDKNTIKQINTEYSAVIKLFSRSFSIPHYALIRSLNAHIASCKDNKNPEKKNDSTPNPR